ncbi:hypothetical protein AB7952_17280 [Streptomyces sp. PG2]
MSVTGPQGSRRPGLPSVSTLYAQVRWEKGSSWEVTARTALRPSASGGVQPRTLVSVLPQ